MVAEQEGRLDQRSSLVGRRSQRRGLAGQAQIALLDLHRGSASKDRIRGVSFVFIVEKSIQQLWGRVRIVRGGGRRVTVVGALILRFTRRRRIGVHHYVGRDGKWTASDEALRSRCTEWV